MLAAWQHKQLCQPKHCLARGAQGRRMRAAKCKISAPFNSSGTLNVNLEWSKLCSNVQKGHGLMRQLEDFCQRFLYKESWLCDLCIKKQK